MCIQKYGGKKQTVKKCQREGDILSNESMKNSERIVNTGTTDCEDGKAKVTIGCYRKADICVRLHTNSVIQ